MKTSLLLSFFLLFASGCALLESRSFEDQMALKDDSLFKANEDFYVVRGDTGRAHRSYSEIMARTPAGSEFSFENEYTRMLREELISLEDAEGENEFAIYEKYRTFFSNDSERIYYLRLPKSERTAYLESRGFSELRFHDPSGQFATILHDETGALKTLDKRKPASFVAPLEWVPSDMSRRGNNYDYSR